jgi:hypothetical protein
LTERGETREADTSEKRGANVSTENGATERGAEISNEKDADIPNEKQIDTSNLRRSTRLKRKEKLPEKCLKTMANLGLLCLRHQLLSDQM